MKNTVLSITIAFTLSAAPVAAEEGYKFKVSVTSAFDALCALGERHQQKQWETATEERGCR